MWRVVIPSLMVIDHNWLAGLFCDIRGWLLIGVGVRNSHLLLFNHHSDDSFPPQVVIFLVFSLARFLFCPLALAQGQLRESVGRKTTGLHRADKESSCS